MSTILITPDMIEEIEQVDGIELDHPKLEVLLNAEFEAKGRPGFTALAPAPIHADCNTHYKAVHFSGRRPLSVIDLQVIHSEEAATALAAASWFENQAAGGSATYCVDDNICYRTLQDDQIPWGAPGANYHGLHYEQAGYAHWTKVLWSKTHRRTLMRTASKVARDARRYGITPRWLDAATLKKGMRNGVTDHRTCTAAFGGTHTDPGANYPRLLFMSFVKLYYTTTHRKVRRVA